MDISFEIHNDKGDLVIVALSYAIWSNDNGLKSENDVNHLKSHRGRPQGSNFSHCLYK